MRWPGSASSVPAAASAPAGHNRYVALVRLAAILVVVVGHWLNTIVVVNDATPTGQSALEVIGYARWLTLALQVMPMFFLAGGYAAAVSWPRWTGRGGRWAGWTHSRLVRLLKPTSWYLGIMAALTWLALLVGLDRAVVEQAGWGVALQLWFLPVYMLMVMIAVPLVIAWERTGWLAVAACVLLVAGVDVGLRMGLPEAVGWASFLPAPAGAFLLGIAWHAGALDKRVVRAAMLVGGVVALVVLVAFFDYPPWMIGVPGEPSSNTNPPNLALVAYATAQIGAVLLLERPLQRWLERPRVWTTVIRGNAVIMSLYLWHMVPVLIVGALMVALGLPAGPTPGALAWWAWRIVWIGVLAVLLAGVVAVVGRFERVRSTRRDLAGSAAASLLVVCAALTGVALSRLALGGFAADGHLAVGALAAYAAGVVALWLAGRVRVPGDR